MHLSSTSSSSFFRTCPIYKRVLISVGFWIVFLTSNNFCLVNANSSPPIDRNPFSNLFATICQAKESTSQHSSDRDSCSSLDSVKDGRSMIHHTSSAIHKLLSRSTSDHHDKPDSPLQNLLAMNILQQKSSNRRSSRTNKISPVAVKTKKQLKPDNFGIYYGLGNDFLRNPKYLEQEEEEEQEENNSFDNESEAKTSVPNPSNNNKEEVIEDILTDTLTQFQTTAEELRDTLGAIREEISELSRIQKEMLAQSQGNNPMLTPPPRSSTGDQNVKERRKEFEKIENEVELWARNILFEQGVEEDGWKEVECNKLMRNKYNKRGNIKCYLKWMPESRSPSSTIEVNERGDDSTDSNDGEGEKLYPCIRVYSTIDAPFERVCDYLAQPNHLDQYNDLVVHHNDLEDITPHSKVCYGQSPQILFVKPRDFVTFCSHRWKNNGREQVVVNQACSHPKAPVAILNENESKSSTQSTNSNKVCRAYALRGANFLSRDPMDDTKTHIAIVAHADPGGGLPQWACKAAINAVAPIEPFKLFYNIENGVKKHMARLSSSQLTTNNVSSFTKQSGGKWSEKPGGLSQLGYACFWPNGGGLNEQAMSPSSRPFEDGNNIAQQQDYDDNY